MKPISAKTVAVALLAALAAGGVLAQQDNFDQTFRQLRDAVRSGKPTKAELESVKKLTVLAANVDQRVEAWRLMADAQYRAGQYRDSANAWKQVFELEKERPGDDRVRRVFEAGRSRLWELQRLRPLPAKDLEAAAREALAWDDAENYSVGQKMDYVGYIIKAREQDKGRAEVARDVEKMARTGEFGKDMRVSLLDKAAELALDAGDAEKTVELCQAVLEDEQATPAQRGMAMLREAQVMHRENRYAEAIKRAEEAMAEFDAAVNAGADLDWQTMNTISWAGRAARNDTLDYEKAMFFFNKMFSYTDTGYWQVPARLEIAQTYRDQRQFDKAMEQYDAILKGEERYAPRALLPRAEMVFYEMDDAERGLRLLKEAFMSDQVGRIERYRALFRLADEFEKRREYEKALEWLALQPELPNQREGESTRYGAQALYMMGRIEEARGRTEEAKAYYRRAMALDGGDMNYRVRSRDALEDIEYFE